MNEPSLPPDPSVAVECTIRRSAFSSERTYELALANGTAFIGTEQTSRLSRRDGRAMARDEPARGESLPGLISARRIEIGNGGTVLVGLWNLIDWTTLRVAKDRIREG